MCVLSECILINIFIFLSTIAVLIYLYFQWSFTYWRRRGFPSIAPSFPFGNITNFVLQQISFPDLLAEAYAKIKERFLPHAGFYFFNKPVYIPIDQNIIKHILIADFQYFQNRGFSVNSEIDPLGANLVNLEGEKWKNLRAKLTSTFTSGKIKNMFPTIVKCTTQLQNVMDEIVETNHVFNIKEVLGRFTTDIIGNCAFGIDVNCLEDPTSEFLKYSQTIFTVKVKDVFKFFSTLFLPKHIVAYLKIKLTSPDVEVFYRKLVKDTVEYRETNNIKRNDFMDLLIELKNSGVAERNSDKVPLTLDEITAHALLFIIAGSESSSSTSSFAMYELAKNQELQAQVRDEINRCINESGELTYEALSKMALLDLVIQETLRKYMNGVSVRVCNKNYKIPGTSLVLENGTLVMVPFQGFGLDPEYFPSPEIFDPGRFTEENIRKRPSCVSMPFGCGPRSCIGMRFGLVQTKVCMASMLKSYNFTVNSKTLQPLRIEPASLVITVKGGVWLNATKV